ncbi:hypothetical protein KP509_14G063300 [Ceratopteris richardii]|nr:hypothetical protein KP509_14G063300 [Ceratopteris richardii]
MQAENIYPDAVTFTSILTACASMKRVYLGEQIHDEILKQGLLSKDIALGNALVSMYAKCSALGKARRVLEEMLVRDVISWSTLIGGYAQNGEDKQALDCYDEMQSDGIPPNTVTFLSIIEACGNLGLTFKGEQVHEEVKRLRLLDNNIVLGTALLDMYMKCGSFRKAWQVLEGLPTQTVVSWSAIISGYVNKGEYRKAIACFEKMQTEGVPPNQVTFASILKACGCLGDADTGRRIHHEVAQHGLLRDDVVLATALVDMYVQCGALGAAQQALSELPFRNVIMWNSLIAGYVARGQNRKAVACYEEMNNEGLSPNAATFACMLKACGSSRVIKKGTLIHRDIMQQSLLQKNTVLGNALVHMYVSCSALTKAHQVLEELPIRNCISWSTLIAGYAQHCEVERVFICFEQMLQEGCSPDVVTFTCILKACTMLGAVEIGEKIHLEVARQGLLENVSLGTALVDMYAKCGDIVKAHQVLNETSIKDVGCWNALIGGYIQEGKFQQAFSLFDFMLLEKLTPNAITFLGMLRACSLLGLLDDAKVFVDIMSMRYGINLEFKHGSSIADLCCHLGYLDKALKAI